MEKPKAQTPNPKSQQNGMRLFRRFGIRDSGFGMWVLTVILTTTACGKKGPPLLPFVRQPKAAEITGARLMGSDVYLTIAVPTANIDESTPASLEKIEVFGLTALTTPSVAQVLNTGTRVMTIPVARHADPSDRSGTVVPDPKTGALQGTSVTIREMLTPDATVPHALPSSAKATEGKPTPRGSTPSAAAVAAATSAPEVLRRFYATVPFSAQRRSGPPSKVIDLALTMIPGPVPALRVTRTGHKVDLQWEPAGGLLGWLMDRALPVESSPVVERQTAAPAVAPPAPPSGPTLYNVYLEIGPDPLALPRSAAAESLWAASPAVPINMQPLTSANFTIDIPFDGRQRCYYVRGLRGTGAQRVEGEASESRCVDSFDDEAPAAVTGLTVTPVEGSINLRWEPNGEEDLVGYVVSRREVGSDTLRTLTPKPIPETRFTDSTDLMAGQMYTYVVQAVDTRIPLPNASEPGEGVTVTAR